MDLEEVVRFLWLVLWPISFRCVIVRSRSSPTSYEDIFEEFYRARYEPWLIDEYEKRVYGILFSRSPKQLISYKQIRPISA